MLGGLGSSPLAAASLRGHSTCVQALIDAKALIDSPSDAGLTALMEAAVQGKDRVVECLIRNGALTSLHLERLRLELRMGRRRERFETP